MYEIASVSLADEGVYEAYIGGAREMGAITRLIVRSKSRGSFFQTTVVRIKRFALGLYKHDKRGNFCIRNKESSMRYLNGDYLKLV